VNMVLYLHETSRLSGAENSLLALCEKIDRSRFTPIFALPDEGPLYHAVKALGIDVFLTRFPRIRRGRGVIPATRRLIRLVRERGVRLLHSNSIRTHIYAALTGRSAHIPVVWHERNMITNEKVDPDRLFSFLPDRIICNSHAIARRFQRRGRLPAKMQVIHNGVNTERFNPGLDPLRVRTELGISPDEIVVGIASRFNPIKGHEMYFEAARRLIYTMGHITAPMRFLVVGGAVFDEDRRRGQFLKDLVAKLSIGRYVLFTGFRQDMPAVYAAMDMLVLSSHTEACGRVILEAMAVGRPIVGTNSGGTPEIIVDGRTGFLVPPNDALALAERVAVLATDPGQRRKMGEAARTRIEEEFSIEKNVAQIEAIYDALLKEERAP